MDGKLQVTNMIFHLSFICQRALGEKTVIRVKAQT